ncbi:hypothetical protein B2G71_05175 [Novosphingobium sp. PC22D]|uniref:hypothetical protein n=1 Tax=Novosphingobium sp. PC22D TaxID=1962403 RepID=UPI000BEFAA59|nr:hypothetical protein [Novosphingobium sp. PC22D]PEQ13713.1 hypothetical protein B2G71_05175 [Novosphingobium sp. PC22D]
MLIGAVLAGGLIFAVRAHRDERVIRELAGDAKRVDAGPPDRTTEETCVSRSNPRILLACAVLYLNLAAREAPGPGRDAALLAALRFSERLQGEQPGSGEASVLRSLAAAQLGREHEAMVALQESYRRAPYLRDFALARIALAARSASHLDPVTRRTMLTEAIWLGRLGRRQRLAVLDALAGTDSYITVSLRLPGSPVAERPL